MTEQKYFWLALCIGLIGTLCCGQRAAAESEPAELTDAELAVTAPADARDQPNAITDYDAEDLVLEGVVEFGYQDEQGRYVVDLLEQDTAYLGLRITTRDGDPVVGATPKIAMAGSSTLLLQDPISDVDGIVGFGVRGGQMGLDNVTASIGKTSVKFAINVISQRATGFPTLEPIEGGIGWDVLLQAQFEYKDLQFVASFPESVTSRAGTIVKLSGFMMPLEPELKQRHFLLTSSPPSCFFHIPGGPAGSVEVLAPDGIEASWEPVVVEGRFEPQRTNEMGVVYRLLDARLVKQ